MLIDIKSLLPSEIEQLLQEIGEPKYRARQIFSWLNGGAESFDVMTNLSKDLRAKLSTLFYISVPAVISKQISRIDGTIKYLWRLLDGNAVEAVIMRYKYGNSLCISTQVGCRQGCAFCASTIGGLIRNLQPSELLDEVIFSQKDSGLAISNIVLMGIGEPLDNFDNVIKFLKLVNHVDGLNIGMRHITLSTCGLTEKFDKLAELNLQLTLSISLHAPDDETRSKILPVNLSRGVEDLLSACRRYFLLTGRRISFEYALIDGVNDTQRHAKMLSYAAKSVSAHVNLIPLNYVDERSFKPSSPENIKSFFKILKDSDVNVTLRRRLGSDVNASCGQLRRSFSCNQ